MRAALRIVAPQAPVPARGVSFVRLAGRDAVLLVTGVGPVNAALEAGALLGGCSPRGVLHMGIAGSYDLSRAPLGAILAANAESWPEYGVAGPDAVAEPLPGFPQWVDEAGQVHQTLELAPRRDARTMDLALPPAWFLAGGVTVAGITAHARRAQLLAGRNGALFESMEGFALALACRTRCAAFLEVRAVSNLVGERDRARWRLREALDGLGGALATLLRVPHVG